MGSHGVTWGHMGSHGVTWGSHGGRMGPHGGHTGRRARLHARRGPGLSEGVCKLDHVLAAREDGALEEKLESLADAHARHHEDRPRRADEGGDKLVQHHRADVVVVLL
eukprot:5775704-Prymnesium_polylepis.1